VPEAAIRAFHSPCHNQPQVSRPKFRLETNSTVVWLYAGDVSLILPDVQFGMVSLDWVTNKNICPIRFSITLLVKLTGIFIIVYWSY